MSFKAFPILIELQEGDTNSAIPLKSTLDIMTINLPCKLATDGKGTA